MPENTLLNSTQRHGNTTGSTKFDGDKPQMDLVPLSSVHAVAQVMTFGAKKYSANGWKDVPDARNRYTAAMLRHMTAVQDGEEIDPDSGLPHLDHIACNALFLSWFRRNPQRGLPVSSTPPAFPQVKSHQLDSLHYFYLGDTTCP